MGTENIPLIYGLVTGSISLIVLFALIVGFTLYLHREKRKINKNLDEQMARMQKMLAQHTDDSFAQALGQVWLTKHRENVNYYMIVTRQIRLTFSLALGSAIFGLVLFAITITTASLFHEKLLVALVPAVSAAIVEMFSGIVLAIHRATLKEVTHFGDLSNQDERLYSVLLLASNLSPKNREEVLTTILEGEVSNSVDSDTSAPV